MSDGSRFTRNAEDFVCENCGAEVRGSGYTDHCPRCLWSKHVDVWPGDRAETCRGLMKPAGFETHGDAIDIVFECTRCGAVRRNKSSSDDDVDTVIRLMGEIAARETSGGSPPRHRRRR